MVMWQLYQFPLCPFSRKVRLLLSEKGIAYELWRENPWERREGFTQMNHAARTPTMHDPERASRCATAGRSANIWKRPRTARR
jgi:glutathione S-transferase